MHTLAKSASMGVNHPAPRVIPMVSTKGGEGKSTQSANLAGFLADAGKKLSSSMVTTPNPPQAAFSPWNMKPPTVCMNC